MHDPEVSDTREDRRGFRDHLSWRHAGDRVLYFTVAPVPVATRHQLIQRALDDHSIELEVFDGVALAEHLADYDLFWIAAEYLRLPSSLAPERPDSETALPGWYLRDRETWRARATPGRSMGDLVSVKDLLRHATFRDEARPDLGDWLGRMREFLIGDAPADVKMRARYEIAVATLRGSGTLRPADDLLRQFYRDLNNHRDDLPLLADSVVLLQYGYGARIRGVTDVAMGELDAWYEELRHLLESEISASPFPNTEAALLINECPCLPSSRRTPEHSRRPSKD